jgi:tRNA pseudouridine55 synthase
LLLANKLAESSLLLIHKDKGFSSFYYVKKIRYILSKKCGIKKLKVGHAGTLDPFAEGLLLIACGKYTKQLQNFIDLDKSYTFTFKLGEVSDSYDNEGKILFVSDRIPELKEIEDCINLNFCGKIQQEVPAFSAVKVDGRKLYELARKGLETKLPVKTINIIDFRIHSYEYPYLKGEIACSKGTYIRSIANDLGKILGTGAYCDALCRSRIGDFQLSQAWKLDVFTSIIEKTIIE